MTDDAFKAAWRRQFALVLHPYSRRTETLIETADKLIAARAFIEPLSHSDKTERENGLFVAKLAIRYALDALDQFGLTGGEEYPLPIHLDQAKTALMNVIRFIQDDVHLGQVAVGGADDEADDASVHDASGAAALNADSPKRPKRSEAPDEYEANLKVKKFIDSNPKATIKQVSKATGISVGRISGLDFWRRVIAERKAAKPSPTKAERQLTDKMLASTGKLDDPAEKVMEDEAIWRWILESANPMQRRDLHMKTPTERTKLIDLLSPPPSGPAFRFRSPTGASGGYSPELRARRKPMT